MGPTRRGGSERRSTGGGGRRGSRSRTAGGVGRPRSSTIGALLQRHYTAGSLRRHLQHSVSPAAGDGIGTGSDRVAQLQSRQPGIASAVFVAVRQWWVRRVRRVSRGGSGTRIAALSSRVSTREARQRSPRPRRTTALRAAVIAARPSPGRCPSALASRGWPGAVTRNTGQLCAAAIEASPARGLTGRG